MPLGNLTACEKELVRCTRDGEEFNFAAWANGEGLTGKAWDEARIVDGAIIATLLRGDLRLTGTDPVRPHPRGLRAMGVALLEGLDIAHMTLIAPLRLGGCYIKAVEADGVRATGDLTLRACTIAGAVALMGAHIDGSLSMTGTTLGAPAVPHGLCGDRLTVKGSVFLNSMPNGPRFKAAGTEAVRLVGATINGTFEMRGAQLGEEQANSGLKANRLTVKGSVFLKSAPDGTRFKAEGKKDAVCMMDATIGGTLEMQDARLGGTKADRGLAADRLTILGSVYLNSTSKDTRFEAAGKKDAVCMMGATIGGSLYMQGAKLGGETADNGLAADRLTVKGDVVLNSASDGPRFEAEGKNAVSLLGANINGTLAMQGAWLGGATAGSGLAADRLTVKGSVFLDSTSDDGPRFAAAGMDAVRLPGATIEGQLSLVGATLTTQSGTWLQCQELTVMGTLVLQDNCYDGEGGTVDFTGANLGMLADQADGWPNKADTLVLDGLTYQRMEDCTLAYRLAWLGQQRASHLSHPRDVRPQPFEQCAKVLRQMGHPRDARRVLIEKQRHIQQKWWLDFTSQRPEDKWRCVPWPAWSNIVRRVRGGYHWVRQVLSRATINFGYSSLRPLVWFAGLVLAGWLVYWDAGAEPGDIMVPAQSVVLVEEPYATSKQLPDGYPRFHPFLYSLDVTLPLVELFQEPYWEPAGNKAPDNKGWFSGAVVRWFQIAQVVGGWVFISLFVAGLANAIRRDD